MQRGTYGFWRGVLAALVVVIVAALALAWLYPPLRAPEVDEGMQVPPAPPSAPPGVLGGWRVGADADAGARPDRRRGREPPRIPKRRRPTRRRGRRRWCRRSSGERRANQRSRPRFLPGLICCSNKPLDGRQVFRYYENPC